MGTKQILETVFNDVRLVTFVYDNKEVWFASQIAEVLGYSRPGKLSTQIRGSWRGRFEEGKHFLAAASHEVRHILSKLGVRGIQDVSLTSKSLILFTERGVNRVLQNVSLTSKSLILLTERGVNRVLGMSNKPTAYALQDHLADVVLPQFRRGMIEERPAEELEAAYRQEVDQLKTKLIERDEEVIQLHREKSDLQHEHIQLHREKTGGNQTSV